MVSVQVDAELVFVGFHDLDPNDSSPDEHARPSSEVHGAPLSVRDE
jgi:hypothetical protein